MATKTTPNSPAAWRPDITAFIPQDVIPDALLLTTSTVVGQIEGDEPAVRVPYVSDDGTPGFVNEGEPIPDADQAFSEVIVQTRKLAAVGKYSYETLQQPNAAELVTRSLSRSVIASADTAYLGNDGQPTGLLQAPGITDGGTITDSLDPLVDAIAGIEQDGGTPTHIIAAPDAWANLSKLKTGTGSQQALLGAGIEAGERRLHGVNVTVTPAAPPQTLLVVDQNAIVSAASPVRLARSEDAFFANDVVAIRVTWRIGWNIMRPARIAQLTTSTTNGD